MLLVRCRDQLESGRVVAFDGATGIALIGLRLCQQGLETMNLDSSVDRLFSSVISYDD